MEVKDEVKKIAFEIKEDLIEIRRYLHKHPELSFKEINTSSFIKASLDKIAVPWVSITDTGVLATIKGYASAGKVIALRADIDALPIQEETGWSFNPFIRVLCMPVVMIYIQLHYWVSPIYFNG